MCIRDRLCVHLSLFAWANQSCVAAFGVNAAIDPHAWFEVSLTGLPREPITLWCCSSTSEWQACGELASGVLARAVSLQSLLFCSARCCAETLCVMSVLIHFFEQWASVCLSLWLFLRLKPKITLLSKLHLALSAQKGVISQASTGSYIAVFYCLLSQQVMQNEFQTYAAAQTMNT